MPGITFRAPLGREALWGRSTRWLTVITVDPAQFGATREDIRLALDAANIASRPVWKPMHLRPVFRGCEVVGGAVAEDLFERGLCLPSGCNTFGRLSTSLAEADLARVAAVVRSTAR